MTAIIQQRSKIVAPGVEEKDHSLDTADPFLFFFDGWG